LRPAPVVPADHGHADTATGGESRRLVVQLFGDRSAARARDVTSEQPHDLDALCALAPGRVAVVLVDFQTDFCGGASLGAPVVHNARTALRASEFASRARELGAEVIYTRQVVDPERLSERQRRWEGEHSLARAGTEGAELFIEPIDGAHVVAKDRFDVWQSREFTSLIERLGVEALVIGGVELRCCVLFAVLGADERGFRYCVPQDLVSGLDTGEEGENKIVREYLRLVHGSPESAEEILIRWSGRSG
jgi:nicotinamidase-related amidase